MKKRDLSLLAVFISGIAFFNLLYPLLEKIVEFFLSLITLRISKHTVQTVHMQKEIDDMQQTEQQTFAVGFQAPEDYEEYEECEDE